MRENVTKFFELYNSDPALKQRVEEAVMYYPGSLEIRESLVKATLLPIAESIGLEFTVEELRAYETRLKLDRAVANSKGSPEADALCDGVYEDDEPSYWLLDHGWSDDESKFKSEK